jgi:hypothetical protein
MPFIKGHRKMGGRAKGTPNKETMTKLERRAYFERRAQEKFDDWIEKCRPEYGLDQFLGPIKTRSEVEINVEPEISPGIKELADKLNAMWERAE